MAALTVLLMILGALLMLFTWLVGVAAPAFGLDPSLGQSMAIAALIIISRNGSNAKVETK